MPPFRLTQQEALNGGDIIRDRLESGYYSALVAGSVERNTKAAQRFAANQGSSTHHLRFIDVPAVQVAVDATIITLTQNEVEERLPLEVSGRIDIACDLANHVARELVRANLIGNLFRSRDARAALTKNDLLRFQDLTYLGSIAAGSFVETGMYGGGAHRFLRHRTLSEPIGDIIARSSDLLLATNVPRGQAEAAYTLLGYPYIFMRHLQMQAGEDKVHLTDEIKQYLLTLRSKGSGCPAQRMPAMHSADSTLLQQSWEALVAYAIPPNATTYTRNMKPPME